MLDRVGELLIDAEQQVNLYDTRAICQRGSQRRSGGRVDGDSIWRFVFVEPSTRTIDSARWPTELPNVGTDTV